MLPWQQLPWQNQGYQSPYANLLPQQQYSPLESIARIGLSIPAVKYQLEGADLGPQQDLAAQISQIANAQYNPNNPIYQQLYEDERGQGMQDLSAAIAEMSRQNRKLSQLGRVPLFNPERGGEQIFRGLTQGYQDIQSNARQKARDILGVSNIGLSNAFSKQAQLTGAKEENKKQKVSGFESIAKLLPLLGSIF